MTNTNMNTACKRLLNSFNVEKLTDAGHAMILLDDGLYYIVRASSAQWQVYSALPADKPKTGGVWCSGWNESGIKYVAKGRTRSAAMAQWKRNILSQPYVKEIEI